MSKDQDRTSRYQEGSLTLPGTVMLGTGVMIGAGIFALTGQMAQMAGALFPLAFLAAAIVISFSSYSYIKISNAYPSAGGIGMYLHKAYGDRLSTGFNALLMYFSMVIAQSFLARTFGSYTMQLFGGDEGGRMVPILGVSLILTAFVINLLGNRWIQGVASFIGILKISGILVFGPNSSPASLQVLPAVSALGSNNRMRSRLTSQGSSRITTRSSRNHFVPPNTWQVKLAMCLAPLRVSA